MVFEILKFVDLVDEFTYDGDDDLLELFTIGLKPITKFFDQRVEGTGINKARLR